MVYLYLLVAIVSEVIATTALKASESFTRPWPTLVVVVGYGATFFFLSRCLSTISIGAAYAIWSGLGIVLVTVTGAMFYRQVPDRAAILGLALIIAGVVVVNLFSKTTVH